MTVPNNADSHGACKFLGFKGDPKTHMTTPSARNYCRHFVKPCAISKDMQVSYCLEGKTNECPLAMLDPTAQAPSSLIRQKNKRSILRKIVKNWIKE